MINDTDRQRILVIKLGALGDFVQALGAMAAIREHHKGDHVTLLTTRPFKEFAARSGYFDQIYIDKKPKIFNLIEWLSLRKWLINNDFYRIYDLQNNDRTAIYFRLFPRSKRPQWVGTVLGASHRNTSPQRISGSAFEGHKQTLSLAGINNIVVDDMSWIKEDIAKFKLKQPFVLLVPGCSAQHLQKRWPAEYYAQLAKRLIEKGYQVVLLGSDVEKDIIGQIVLQCPEVVDLSGKTSLFQIISLAHKAFAAIGNDTGPMHMIGPTHCRSIVLFSYHGDPVRHAPQGSNVHVLQQDNLQDLGVDKVIDLFNYISK